MSGSLTDRSGVKSGTKVRISGRGGGGQARTLAASEMAPRLGSWQEFGTFKLAAPQLSGGGGGGGGGGLGGADPAAREGLTADLVSELGPPNVKLDQEDRSGKEPRGTAERLPSARPKATRRPYRVGLSF